MQFFVTFQFGFTGRESMDKRAIKILNAPKDGFFLARKDTRLGVRRPMVEIQPYHYLAIHVYIILRRSLAFKSFCICFLIVGECFRLK